MGLFKREFKRLVKEGKVEENIEGLSLMMNMELLEKFGVTADEIPFEQFLEFAVEFSVGLAEELEGEGIDLDEELSKLSFLSPQSQTIEVEIPDGEITPEGIAAMLGIDVSDIQDIQIIEDDLQLDFSEALYALKDGFKVARANWGGYWFIDDVEIKDTLGHLAADMSMTSAVISEMIVARTKDGNLAPAVPYLEDILAEDWIIVE